MGYFAQHAMELLDGERTVFQSLEAFLPAGRPGLAAGARRLLRLFRRRRREEVPRAVGRREGAAGDGEDAVRSAELPRARRADQPSRHRHQGDADQALSRYEGAMLFVSHDRHFLAALSNRVLELTPEGIHAYGGGYTEYVARTGHEAPGLRLSPANIIFGEVPDARRAGPAVRAT
jgi:hypothetical protein